MGGRFGNRMDYLICGQVKELYVFKSARIMFNMLMTNEES